MKIFILEDDLIRIGLFREALNGQHDLTVCKSIGGPDGAKAKWNPPYDVTMLDHDLGNHQMMDSDAEETGYQFVKFMGQAPSPYDATVVIVHSWNPEGARRMVDLLIDNDWNVERIPFGSTILAACRGWSIINLAEG